jgi:glucose-6-phosphate 1-dehydrogenase
VSSHQPPTTLVIFGASGDLTRRKLIPSLFNLYRKGRLPENAHIVGFACDSYSHAEFRNVLRDGVQRFGDTHFDAARWERFAQRIWFVSGDFTCEGDYKRLHTFLHDLEQRPVNRLYYLATPPAFYAPIVAQLGAAGLADEADGWRRIVVEKPFGYDQHSAHLLNRDIQRVFAEWQIYRIDHYLGKETAQNILFFRFGNSVFESIWDRDHIDNVQITVAESVDVGHRAGYYDRAGVLRDMFQNHLLQLLSLVAMEPPASFHANALRNETAKLLAAVRPITGADVAQHTVRGQYNGYRQTPGISPDSETATYAALRFHIDNWRWKGVPFYLRSGKALASKVSEVVIQFRTPPHMVFPMPSDWQMQPDILSLRLQPHENIRFRFETKAPDTIASMCPVEMVFNYDATFGQNCIPEAYERLLLDALNGDASLFIRSDVIDQSWALMDPIIQAWESGEGAPLAFYEPGSWGPTEADSLVAQDGFTWIDSSENHEEHETIKRLAA